MEADVKNIFDVLVSYSVDEGINEDLLHHEEYMEIQKKIDERTEEVDRQGFTEEQQMMIDRLVCAHTESGAFYGRVTYKQGFRDCASLLQEMNLIKAS